MEETENKYSIKTLNGNWYERKILREFNENNKHQDADSLKKHSYALYGKMGQQKMALSSLRTVLTYFQSPKLCEGDRFMLNQNGFNLSVDLTKPVRGGEYGVFVERGTPLLRRTFSFIRKSNSNLKQPLQHGEQVYVILETPNEMGGPLNMTSRMRSHVNYTEGEDDQEVFFSAVRSPEAYWIIEDAEGREGQLEPSRNIVLKHTRTNRYLKFSNRTVNNAFGSNPLATAGRDLDSAKEQILLKEYVGQIPMLKKKVKDCHIWTVCGAPNYLNTNSILENGVLNIYTYDFWKQLQEKLINGGYLEIAKLRQSLNKVDGTKSGILQRDDFLWALRINNITVNTATLDEILQNGELCVNTFLDKLHFHKSQSREVAIHKTIGMLFTNNSLTLDKLLTSLRNSGVCDQTIFQVIKALGKETETAPLTQQELAIFFNVS